MPGKAPSLVSESLWQMPQACTLIRTAPAAGSGIGRSTISKGPLGRETWATRIVAMRILQRVPGISGADTGSGSPTSRQYHLMDAAMEGDSGGGGGEGDLLLHHLFRSG